MCVFVGADMDTTDTTCRLHLRVGPHEFDAEGREDTVLKQYEDWKRLIVSFDAKPVEAAQPPKTANPFEFLAKLPALDVPKGQPKIPADPDAEPFRKIFQLEGAAISLSAAPNDIGAGEAALVILLGYKLYRDVDQVSGAEILEGLKTSGYPILRADRVLLQYTSGDEMYVMTTGTRRGLKYRLSNPGYAKAKGLAKQILGHVV